jgi:hypothetical protein
VAAPLAAPADGASDATIAARAKRPGLFEAARPSTRTYPHGIGKAKARDRTTGTPVTTFKRSTQLCTTAISHNRVLDRDRYGVACEQA